MKKKFLVIFSLVLLVLPLTGCPNDEEKREKVEVKLSLSKMESDNTTDYNYVLGDCARVSGSGTYDKGSNVTIKVEYVNAACGFEGWKNSDGEIISSSAEYHIPNIQSSLDLKAIIKGKGQIASSRDIYFYGVVKEDIDGRSELLKKYKFPYLQTSSLDTETSVEVRKAKYSLNSNNSSMKLNELFATKAINLNYLYVEENAGSGKYEFKPYKLSWQWGQLEGSNCNFFSARNLDGDPNSFDLNSYNDTYSCLRANLVMNSESLEVKNEAISKMLSSELYIVENKADHACLNTTNTSTSVDQNCMYVSNMRSLYEDSNKEENSMYYGVTSNKLLEAIVTASDKTKNYFICSDINKNCSSANTYKTIYNKNSDSEYKMLKLAEFIGVIEDAKKGKNNIKIQYDYNGMLKSVIPVKIEANSITYFLKYTGDGTSPGYNGNPKLHTGISNVKTALKYAIEFEEYSNALQTEEEQAIINTALELLTDKINTNNMNSIFELSGGNLNQSLVRERLYSIITENESDLKILRNYKFKILEDTINKKLSISVENALLSEDILGLTFVKIENNLCVYNLDEDGCIPQMQKDLISNFEKAINGLTEVNVINISDISESQTRYEFKTSTGEQVRFTYDNSDTKHIIFKDSINDGSIEFTDANKIENLELAEISSSTSTVIGTITQTLETATENIITKIGESAVPDGITIDNSNIIAVYNLFKDGGNYYVNSGDINSSTQLVFISTNDTVVYITKDNEKYTYEYKNQGYTQLYTLTFTNIE